MAVLGMGGYVCVPAGLAASFSGKPLMLVNADAAMLKSNAALKLFAKRIAFGFDGAAAASTSGSRDTAVRRTGLFAAAPYASASDCRSLSLTRNAS